MFSIGKPKSKTTIQSNQRTEFAPVDIHVLPAKFLPRTRASGVSTAVHGKNITTIILIIIFILVLTAGVFAWFYFNKKSVKTNDNINTIAPLTIDDSIDTTVVVTEETVTIPPTPITYISKNTKGVVDGIITLQLSAVDRALAADIKISSNSATSTKQYIVGSTYTIKPLGQTLEDVATLTIEYFDADLSSTLENSLRIAFLNSAGNWQINDNTDIDLNRNQVNLEISELPSSVVAIVSNLTMDEINLSKPNESVLTEFELADLQTSFDTDQDGLSDIEEILFDSNIDRPDTDLDGYVDGDEVKNLYSPIASEQSLLATKQLLSYTNPSFEYSVQYPASWTVNNMDPSANVVLFNSATNQFIEILVENLDPDINTVQEWYKAQIPGLTDEAIRTTTIGPNNYFAILSIDGSAVYFIVDRSVFGIIYNKGIEEEADYLAVWQAMQHSFTASSVLEESEENQ